MKVHGLSGLSIAFVRPYFMPLGSSFVHLPRPNYLEIVVSDSCCGTKRGTQDKHLRVHSYLRPLWSLDPSSVHPSSSTHLRSGQGASRFNRVFQASSLPATFSSCWSTLRRSHTSQDIVTPPASPGPISGLPPSLMSQEQR